MVTGGSGVVDGGEGCEGFHSEPKMLNIIGLCMLIFWLMLKTLSGPPASSLAAFSCLSIIHFCCGPLNRNPSSQWPHTLPSRPRHRKYDFGSFKSTAL